MHRKCVNKNTGKIQIAQKYTKNISRTLPNKLKKYIKNKTTKNKQNRLTNIPTKTPYKNPKHTSNIHKCPSKNTKNQI